MDNTVRLSENQDESNARDNDPTLNDGSKEEPYIAADGIEEEKSEENLDASTMLEEFSFTDDNISKEVTKDNSSEYSFDENHSKNVENIRVEAPTSPETPNEKVTDNLLENGSEVPLAEHLVPRYNKRALPKDCKTYMLETFKRNIMIIFNHEFVNGYERREGTNDDVTALINTFRKFRFDIELHKDKLRKEVGELMVECKYAKMLHKVSGYYIWLLTFT